MGKSISYCYKCSSLLREDDFAKGKAFQDGDRVVCVRCAPELRDASGIRSSTKVAKAQVQTRRIPVAHDSERPAAASRRGLVLGLAAGGLGVILLAAVLLSGRKEAPAPPISPEKPPTVSDHPADRPVVPRAAPEEDLLKAARAYAAGHPEDLAGQVREYERLTLGEFERTPSAREARKEVDAIKAKVLSRVQSAQAALELELEDPLKRDAFAEAVKKIADAGSRLAEPEWALALSKRTADVYDQARRRGTELARTVETLGAQGKTQEIREIVERVRSWQIPREIERIEEAAGAALAGKPEAPGAPVGGNRALPVEAKVRTAEGKAYLAQWEAAMAKVAVRDYTGALDDLTRSAAALKEPETVAESRSDLDDVKRVQSVVQGALAEALARPAPWMVLELRDDRRVAGRVLEVDPDRVAFASRETVFAEWSEVKAASIAALARKEKPDPRLQALLCLLEGDLEPAKAILGAGLEAVPAKYWAWAPGVRARIPRPDGLESSARELLYSAEREYAAMKTRGLAAEKYRSLRKDYLSTSVVRRALGRIERRSDACREYVFAPSDFGRAGTIKLAKSGKLESDADSDENSANQNWAEIEFYALPGTPYRAWVQVGGCCQPVMTFYWQATELTVVSQKTRKP
ncbi:MAG TPA: hypothetical protein VEN81_01535, partial [Planctomycetota bacterium]|nr:hypothetical protein [Planctomycetota bacterium]